MKSFKDHIKFWLHPIVEEVKRTLPEEIEYDFSKHVLPLFFPFLSWIGEVRNKVSFRADLLAGFTGAVIVLPQGIAFALIAGLPPEYGLNTAIVAAVIAAFWGASRHVVCGPNISLSIVIYATVRLQAAEGSQEYFQIVLLLTFLTGIIQLAMSLARMGKYVGFVSQTVVVGFTSGAAVLIIVNQLRNVLGIKTPQGATFWDTLLAIFGHLNQIDLPTFAVAIYTLMGALIIRKLFPRWPYMLLGLLLGALLAAILGGEAAGIKFVANVPRALPAFSVPAMSLSNVHKVFSNAFAIAVLGLVQSVAISRSIALKSGQILNTNQEFFGQGLSNLVGSFFTCYPSSASFTRSALNYEAGAKTPMSVVYAAAMLLGTVLLLAPYTRYLPLPALSGIILLIGWGLFDVDRIRKVRLVSRHDNIIFFATFLTALFAELEFSIYIGVLLSLYFYLKRTSEPNIAIMATDPESPGHTFVNVVRKEVPQCPQLKIIRIDGSLYFGAVDYIDTALRELSTGAETHLLILASGINHVDRDGAEWLAREATIWRKKGGGLYIVRLKRIAQDIMLAGGFIDQIGQDHFFEAKSDAIAAIYQKLNLEVCKQCPYRVFIECEEDKRLPKISMPGDNV